MTKISLSNRKAKKIKPKFTKKPEFENLFKLFLKKSSLKNNFISLKKNSKNNRLRNKLKNQEDNLSNKKTRKPNIKRISYGNRFLIKKRRKLYKKTIGASSNRMLTTTEEFELLAAKHKSILREQRRHFFREKFSKVVQRSKPLSKRAAKAAKIYITYKRKNVFVTIAYVTGENYIRNTEVVAKMSCGGIGYRNKKKTTDFAAEQTIKAGGNFLNMNKVTSIDIIFTSNIPYKTRKVMSKIIQSPLYVRSISFNKNRPHSYVRKRKAQRK